MEFGTADLFSLEPVDHLYRPYRLKKYIRDYSDNAELVARIEQLKEMD